MRTKAAFLGTIALLSTTTPCVLPAQDVDVKRIERFCDLGVRWTANAIDFNVEKLLKLGLKIDPKVLQVATSQAAIYVQELTYICRMRAAGFITTNEYLSTTQNILQYAKDLDTVRTVAEKLTGTPVSEKPDARVDAGEIAKNELGIKIEAAIDTQGELTVILQRLEKKYICLCKLGV